MYFNEIPELPRSLGYRAFLKQYDISVHSDRKLCLAPVVKNFIPTVWKDWSCTSREDRMGTEGTEGVESWMFSVLLLHSSFLSIASFSSLPYGRLFRFWMSQTWAPWAVESTVGSRCAWQWDGGQEGTARGRHQVEKLCCGMQTSTHNKNVPISVGLYLSKESRAAGHPGKE